MSILSMQLQEEVRQKDFFGMSQKAVSLKVDLVLQ